MNEAVHHSETVCVSIGDGREGTLDPCGCGQNGKETPGMSQARGLRNGGLDAESMLE